jgi:hypothetical protein
VILSPSERKEGYRTYTFEPYKVSKFKRLGNLVMVPNFKAQGKLESDFEFPFVNHIGKMTMNRLASIRCRLDYYIHCLAHTVYDRLYRHAQRHMRDSDLVAVRNYLLQVSYCLVIDHKHYDYQLSRLLAMIRHHSKALKRFVYGFIAKLPDNEKGFLRACLRALTPRSQWILPLGGKGRQLDYSKGPYSYVGSGGRIKEISSELRHVYGRWFEDTTLKGVPGKRKQRWFSPP